MRLADRFQAPVLCALSIIIGVAIGWWLRNSQNTPDLLLELNSRPEHSSGNTIAVDKIERMVDDSETDSRQVRFRFVQSIDSGRFDEAFTIFRHHDRYHSDIAAELYIEFIKRIHWYHENNDLKPAINLLELFTEYYSRDSGLLRELANTYTAANQFTKALDAYTNARSYSCTREEIRSLDQQIHQVAHRLYEQGRGESSLGRLIPTFLTLSYLEPDYSFYRFALAEGYLTVNDIQSAIRELKELQIQGHERASELLAQLVPARHADDENSGKTVIPLSGTGGQYVVDTVAGSRHNARMLIDTGSSVTTLPSSILLELQKQKQASRVGDIDLATANGTYRSSLYRLEQFQIGDFLVSNLEAAEFDPVDQSIDGLLGMNVLNHFNFFIDQNRQQLSLMPRQME